MKLYKLTNGYWKTRPNLPNETTWGPNVTNKTQLVKNPRHPRICTDQVIHAYETIPQALLFWRSHIPFQHIILWEAEGIPKVREYDKVGCFKLKTIKQVQVPNWYTNPELTQKIIHLTKILCTEKAVYDFFVELGPSSHKILDTLSLAKEYLLTTKKTTRAEKIVMLDKLRKDSTSLVTQSAGYIHREVKNSIVSVLEIVVDEMLDAYKGELINIVNVSWYRIGRMYAALRKEEFSMLGSMDKAVTMLLR